MKLQLQLLSFCLFIGFAYNCSGMDEMKKARQEITRLKAITQLQTWAAGIQEKNKKNLRNMVEILEYESSFMQAALKYPNDGKALISQLEEVLKILKNPLSDPMHIQLSHQMRAAELTTLDNSIKSFFQRMYDNCQIIHDLKTKAGKI